MADLVLSFTIPDAKVNTAKLQFLAAFPKPSKEPFTSMTDSQWIKWYIKQEVNGWIQRGKYILEEEAIVNDSDDYMPND